jgi:tRNA modification GTPase
VRPDLVSLRVAIAQHLDDRRGERLREGISIAIVGPPNAGKSSLLNVIARRDAAIVSTIAGTTRDVIDVHLDLDGYPVTLADTAGLREAGDPIELEGVRRALMRAEDADLRLLVVPAADGDGRTLDWAAEARAATGVLSQWSPQTDIVVVNKTDLLPDKTEPRPPYLAISAHTGAGVPALLKRLTGAVAALMGEGEESADAMLAPPPLTRARHREALTQCLAALDRALAGPPGGTPPAELVAEDVRLAARALGRITGRVGVEDLLDVIFRDFCIGK